MKNRRGMQLLGMSDGGFLALIAIFLTHPLIMANSLVSITDHENSLLIAVICRLFGQGL